MSIKRPENANLRLLNEAATTAQMYNIPMKDMLRYYDWYIKKMKQGKAVFIPWYQEQVKRSNETYLAWFPPYRRVTRMQKLAFEPPFPYVIAELLGIPDPYINEEDDGET